MLQMHFYSNIKTFEFVIQVIIS